MGIIKITIGNSFLHGIHEEFICSKVDILDLEEIDYCVSECIGHFLENHEYDLNQFEVSLDTLVDNCYYTIEEVVSDEF